MVIPRKGDYASLPLNDEGRRAADAWSPAPPNAADACKPFGAAAIMRVPGRVRHHRGTRASILKIETDAGTQTRLPPIRLDRRPRAGARTRAEKWCGRDRCRSGRHWPAAQRATRLAGLLRGSVGHGSGSGCRPRLAVLPWRRGDGCRRRRHRGAGPVRVAPRRDEPDESRISPSQRRAVQRARRA